MKPVTLSSLLRWINSLFGRPSGSNRESAATHWNCRANRPAPCRKGAKVVGARRIPCYFPCWQGKGTCADWAASVLLRPRRAQVVRVAWRMPSWATRAVTFRRNKATDRAAAFRRSKDTRLQAGRSDWWINAMVGDATASTMPSRNGHDDLELHLARQKVARGPSAQAPLVQSRQCGLNGPPKRLKNNDNTGPIVVSGPA
jgi:hypothetical protein